MKQDAAQSGMDIVAAIILTLLDGLLAFSAAVFRPAPRPAIPKPKSDGAASALNELEYQLFLEVASLSDLENDFLSNQSLRILNSRLKAEGMPCLRLYRADGYWKLRRAYQVPEKPLEASEIAQLGILHANELVPGKTVLDELQRGGILDPDLVVDDELDRIGNDWDDDYEIRRKLFTKAFS